MTVELTEIKHWGYGPVKENKVYGNYLFSSEGTMVVIRDISSQLSPIKISDIDAVNEVHSIYINGNYMYVGTSKNFVIVDISDFYSPFIVGTSATFRFDVDDIIVINDYAFICTDGFRIYNISNKSNPIEVSKVSTQHAISLEIQGNYAYVGEYAGTIGIFDISIPTNVTLISRWSVPVDKTSRGDIYGLKIVENVLYAASYGWGLYAIDISNLNIPTQIGFVGSATVSEAAMDVVIKGNIAYVSWFYKGVVAVDITNPATMTMRNVPSDLGEGYFMTGYTYGIAIDDSLNYLYLSGHYRGTGIYDITSIPNESLVSVIEPRFGRTYRVLENGNYIYLQQDAFLITLDISNPSNPIITGNNYYGGRGWEMVINGNYLYMAGGWAALYIYDISNPATPIKVSTWNSRINNGPYYENGYLHVGRDDVYYILDVSNPLNIQVMGSYTVIGLGRSGFRTYGNYTYINDTGILKCLDVSDPANIIVLGSVPIALPASTVLWMVLYGNYLYVSSGYDNIYIIDVSDKQNLILKNTYYLKNVNRTGSISLYNNYLFATGYTEMEIFNLSVTPINLVPEIKYNIISGIIKATSKYLYRALGYDGPGITIYAHNIDESYCPTPICNITMIEL